MAAKKMPELDERVIKILKEELLDFRKYLTTPQDRKMYERKINEYLDRVKVRVREETITDGRGTDDIATGNNGSN